MLALPCIRVHQVQVHGERKLVLSKTSESNKQIVLVVLRTKYFRHSGERKGHHCTLSTVSVVLTLKWPEKPEDSHSILYNQNSKNSIKIAQYFKFKTLKSHHYLPERKIYLKTIIYMLGVMFLIFVLYVCMCVYNTVCVYV